MTIIYTDNGTRLINEKECVNISHDKEGRCVGVWMTGNKKLPYFKIEGVERVRYVSDGHDFEFDSSTDELKRLNKCLEDEIFRYLQTLDCYNLVRNFCLDILMKVIYADEKTFKEVSDKWNEVCNKIAKKQDEIAVQIGLRNKPKQ